MRDRLVKAVLKAWDRPDDTDGWRRMAGDAVEAVLAKLREGAEERGDKALTEWIDSGGVSDDLRWEHDQRLAAVSVVRDAILGSDEP